MERSHSEIQRPSVIVSNPVFTADERVVRTPSRPPPEEDYEDVRQGVDESEDVNAGINDIAADVDVEHVARMPVIHGGSSSHHDDSYLNARIIMQRVPPKKAKKGPAPKLFGTERCTICASKATGFHYNVLSCEGCKNFFRRAIIKGLIYHCKTGNKVCCVESTYRPRCQWCRLEKCKIMGMKAEYINRTRPRNTSLQQSHVPDRVMNLIETIKRSWEAATEGVDKPTLDSYLDHGDGKYDNVVGIEKRRLDFFLQMAFFKTKRIIKFLNFLPGAHTLSLKVRIWLFKESLAESMVMFNSTTYDPSYGARDGSTEEAVKWLDGEWRGKTAFYQCGMRAELVEPMFEVWRRISDLNLEKAVCALLMVLILINPDRNFPESMKDELDQIHKIQEQYSDALNIYLSKKYKAKASSMIGHSVSILSNLRNISENSLSVQLAQLHKMECQMPELLARLFSYDNSIDIIGAT